MFGRKSLFKERKEWSRIVNVFLALQRLIKGIKCKKVGVELTTDGRMITIVETMKVKSR